MSFSLDMSKALDKIEEDIEETVKGTLFSLSSLIIQGTPVGNPKLWESPPPKGYIGGTLRGAWNASIGSPDLKETGSKDKDGAPTIANVAVQLESFNMGDTFYLSNPQPYAERVEYGHSRKQRPKGMVRVALAQAQQILDSQ